MTKTKLSKDLEHDSSTRVVLEQDIKAPMDLVFPLACPVLEYTWIPAWKCELIHCPNGHAELGTIFREMSSSPILADSIAQKTTWTAVLYDPDNHRVHYRLDNKISSSLYKMEFETNASGGTRMWLDLTYSLLRGDEVGEAKRHRRDKITLMVTVLSNMLVHYCEQGEMMKSSRIKTMPLPVKGLTIVDKLRLIINKFLRRHVSDEDRIKFFKGIAISKVNSS